MLSQSDLGGEDNKVTRESTKSMLSFTGASLKCMRHDRHFSALVFACFSNQLECFKILYKHGKELSTDKQEDFLDKWIGSGQERKECLFYAIANNNTDLFSYLVDEVGLVADLDQTNNDGNTLLHVAAANGNDRAIYKLCNMA